MHGKKRRLKGSLWGIKVEAISHLKEGAGEGGVVIENNRKLFATF